MSELNATPYGFEWGPMQVTRTMSFRGSHVVTIAPTGKPESGQALDIYVSATGRSIRVFRGNKELKVIDSGSES